MYFPKLLIRCSANFVIPSSSSKIKAIHGLLRFRILTSELTNLSGHSVRLLGRMISRTQGLYLHTGQHNKEKRGYASMPRTGFEPAIPVLERSKTVRASDRAANGTIFHDSNRMKNIGWALSHSCTVSFHK
jgi:hypothetical protein